MAKPNPDFEKPTVCNETPILRLNSVVPATFPAGPHTINLTTAVATVTPHSVERKHGIMADGRSGMIVQTSVPQTAASVIELKREAHAAHERHLQQIGADLHDGPAQLLALTLLHIDQLTSAALNPIRDIVAEALQEIRDISVGLVLPELDRRTAKATVRLAVDNYQRRTGCMVTVDDDGLPADFNPSKAIKICLYRIVQEGLQNSFKHACGADQSVTLSLNPATDCTNATLVTIVRDVRPGPCTVTANTDEHSTWRRSTGTSTGIGLTGLKERISALNGILEIVTTTGGTELIARMAVMTNN